MLVAIVDQVYAFQYPVNIHKKSRVLTENLSVRRFKTFNDSYVCDQYFAIVKINGITLH